MLAPSAEPRKPDAVAPVPALGYLRGRWAVAIEAVEGSLSETATGSVPVFVDVVGEVTPVRADVATGTVDWGVVTVTVATDVVTTAVVLGTVTGTVAAGVVTVVPVGTVTVAGGTVRVAVGDVTVGTLGTVSVCVATGVDNVTVGSPMPPSWLPASTFAPKKPVTARQTSAMRPRRVIKRSRSRPPLVVPPQWARFLSPFREILARSGNCRNLVPAPVQGKCLLLRLPGCRFQVGMGAGRAG
jgi:hypothetical protein